MPLQVGQSVELVDTRGRRLGRLAIDGVNADLVEGIFTRGPDYAAVEPLMRAFEEAVEGHALGGADRHLQTIDALDLRLETSADSMRMPVRDVQIWSDGGMSCRLRVEPLAAANGAGSAARGTAGQAPLAKG
jgi:hypothetical protein